MIFQGHFDSRFQGFLFLLNFQIIFIKVVSIDYFTECAHTHFTESVVLGQKDIIHTVHNGIEIVGDHKNCTIVIAEGLLQGYLGMGIHIVAAVIRSENKEGEPIIFATQRGYGDLKGGWEFPGGKIEEGETPQEALKREIMEELETEISVGDLIDTIEYDYPTFHLMMDCFWAKIVSGDLVLNEHNDAKWLRKEELNSVEWLPADISLIDFIEKEM